MFNGLWETLTDQLRREVDPEDFQLWIKPLKPLPSREGRLVLCCPNHLHLRMVRERYLPAMKRALGQHPQRVELSLVTPQARAGRGQGPRQLELPNMGLRVPRLNRRFVFDKFVAGGGNELAWAAARALAQGRQRLFTNTLFLVSDTGLGKSHLTQAVGHQVLCDQPGTRVVYITAEDFTNQMISALSHKRIESFKERYRRECDVLLLEEVQFLAGKDKTQDELGYTLDALLDAGKRVVFTSSCPVSRMKGLKGSLLSRISSGMTVSIEPPDHRTRVRILERLAKEEGVQVDLEVLEYLAQEITDDVRRLQSALVGLMAKGSLTGRPLDHRLAAEVLGQMAVRLRRVTPEQIRDLVARTYGLEVSVLTGKGRSRAVTRPRNLAMALCRRHTDASYAAIGKVFNRDHATVMYGVNKIDRELTTDPRLAQELAYLEQRLGVS